MKATLDKAGNLVIEIPHGNLKDLPETDSKLSHSLASTGGNQAVSLTINGTPMVVKIGVNAFIPIPGRKKVKDSSRPLGYYVIDTVTGKEV